MLKPGGYLIFSDILQAKNCNPKKMNEVYRRIHLSSLGCVEDYIATQKASGLKFLRFEDYSDNIETHYILVLRALEMQRDDLVNVSDEYIENAIFGLNVWVRAAREKQLHWVSIMSSSYERIYIYMRCCAIGNYPIALACISLSP